MTEISLNIFESIRLEIHTTHNFFIDGVEFSDYINKLKECRLLIVEDCYDEIHQAISIYQQSR